MDSYYIILFWDNNPSAMTPFHIPNYEIEDMENKLVTFKTKEAAEDFAKANLKGTDVVVAHIVSEI